MPENECHPFYEIGDVTFQATAAVTGKRFVAPSGNRQSGPGLSSDALGGNYRMAHAAAGAAVAGVSTYDVPNAGKGGCLGKPGRIVPVTADGAITAGDEVEVGTAGKATTLGTGKAVGIAMTGAADAADAEIKLY